MSCPEWVAVEGVVPSPWRAELRTNPRRLGYRMLRVWRTDRPAWDWDDLLPESLIAGRPAGDLILRWMALPQRSPGDIEAAERFLRSGRAERWPP